LNLDGVQFVILTLQRSYLTMPAMARTSAKRKRSYHHGDLRRALLDEALRLIEKEGPRALTLREVARRAGVSQAAPYHHFADKEAMLAAVAEEGFVELLAAQVEARDAAGDEPIARLQGLGRGYIRFAVQHPAHYRVMFVGAVEIPKHAALHEAAHRTFEALMDVVVEGQKAGVLRSGNPSELAVIVWSMMHGLAMLWTDCRLEGLAGPFGGIEALAASAGDALVRGLSR